MIRVLRAKGVPSNARKMANKFQYYKQPRKQPWSLVRTLKVSSIMQKSELLEAVTGHPLMVAITGGGGVTLLAALYKNPQFWKIIGHATIDRSILILPQKPSHIYQSRKLELNHLSVMVKQLLSSGKGVANVVYVTGQPGHGKTQLVREFGKKYYKKNKRVFFRKQFVGTLNASSKSSLIHSYITLAMELGCANELSSLNSLTGVKGELQSLEILSDIVRKELKKRSKWLLIIDGLSGSSQDMSIGGSMGGTLSVEAGGIGSMIPALVPPIQQDPILTGFSRPSSLNVGASYGIRQPVSSWKEFWPQPGSENWGSGIVIVTTHDRNIVQTSSPFIKELFLKRGMEESDAISLLQKVSGCHGDGCIELVNLLDRVPLSIASAGFYIKSERTRNRNFSFINYLEAWSHGIQEEGEKMLGQQNKSYPVTMKMAVAMSARQLASNPSLNMVFTLVGLCGQSPIPMSVVARVVGVRPDINSTTLELIRNCVLLQVSRENDDKNGGDGVIDVEKVSIYNGTREILKELFLGSEQQGSEQQLFSKVHHFIDCLVNEYESARGTETIQSYRLQHLIIPHLENIVNGHSLIPGFRFDPLRETRLLNSLGDAYLLKGKPQQARIVLEKGLNIFEEIDEGRSLQAAKLATRLGVTYRQLGLLAESEFILREALSVFEQENGSLCIEVGEVMVLLSATLKSLGHYQESRKCLEQALVIYESVYGTRHVTVATVLTNLGSTWRKLGNSMKSKELFEKALKIEHQLLEPLHPMIADTLGNLSVAYTDLGNPSKSIELLNQALLINKHIHGPEHISLAITMSQLSNAYRHLGDMNKSKSCAKEALQITRHTHGPLYPGMGVALGILGSTYFEMGEVSKACELLGSSVTINKTIYGQKHVDTAIVETQLGNALRLSGKLRQSKELLESTLSIKEELLESDHPSLAVTLNALGKVCHELGYYTDSIRTIQRGRQILKHLYSTNHPQVLFIEADLARVLRDTDTLQYSAEMMNNAITNYNVSTTGYTRLHPKYASMLAIHGLILRDMGELSDAKRFLLDALELQKQVLGFYNLMKVETLCNLGTVQHRLQQNDEALKSLNGALDMMNHLGDSVGHAHPLRSTVLVALGRLLLEKNDVKNGQMFFDQGVKIRTETCGEFHPNIALYYELKGRLSELNHQDRSHYLREAVQIYSSLLKRERPLSNEYNIRIPMLEKWEEKIRDYEL